MWQRQRITGRQPSARAGHRRKLAKETLESRVVLSATIGNHIEIGTEMRNYRLAIAATAEYTALLGGQAAALSSIEAFVDEVNQIFENKLAIHFDLVSGRNTVFTDSRSDGYTNGAVATMAAQNTDRLNTVLGNGDPLLGATLYDIGHVFGTAVSGRQGTGGLGVVNTNHKGFGASISSSPVGPDWVKLVAHEFAHQFNAEHIFNGNQFGATVGQRAATNAYEPASGSSLMSYAGIAGPDNLQDTGLIADQLYVNGGVARPDRPIERDALLAQADAAGEIRVVLTDLPGGANADGVQPVSAVLSIDPVSTLDSQYDLVAERLVHITAKDNQMLPLVGVDFEASSGTNLSPVNWNFAGQSSTSGFTLTDLSDEEGNATPIDLSVVGASALTGFDAPPATNLPQHPNPLDEVAGILYSSSSATLIWSDLKAGAAYDLWIMGASSFTNPFGQTVTINGGDPDPLPFNMDYTVVPNNTLRISSSVGSPVLNFDDYAIRATADSNGQIRLLVDKMPGRQFIAFGAVAIREVLLVPSFNAALAVTTEGDETGPVDLVYTVTLDPLNTTGGPILFDFRDLGSGTAQAGSDYLAIPGDATIVVPDGSSTGTYTVSVIDDPDVESLETVSMRITNPSVSGITLSTSTALHLGSSASSRPRYNRSTNLPGPSWLRYRTERYLPPAKRPPRIRS